MCQEVSSHVPRLMGGGFRLRSLSANPALAAASQALAEGQPL